MDTDHGCRYANLVAEHPSVLEIDPGIRSGAELEEGLIAEPARVRREPVARGCDEARPRRRKKPMILSMPIRRIEATCFPSCVTTCEGERRHRPQTFAALPHCDIRHSGIKEDA